MALEDTLDILYAHKWYTKSETAKVGIVVVNASDILMKHFLQKVTTTKQSMKVDNRRDTCMGRQR